MPALSFQLALVSHSRYLLLPAGGVSIPPSLQENGRRRVDRVGPGQGLTLPVMLVVTHAGQGDHHGAVQGQDGSTEPPALPPPTLREAVQLASQGERCEAKA